MRYGWGVEWSGITFLDVEADRSGRVRAIGAVRGEQELRLDPQRLAARTLRRRLAAFAGDGPLAGHNLVVHDLPLLAREPLAFAAGRRVVVDTLVLSLLAWPPYISPRMAVPKMRQKSMLLGRLLSTAAHYSQTQEASISKTTIPMETRRT